MSETFNLHRFGTYFRFDLSRMWRSHAKAAMFIGGAGIILYLIWGLFGLLLTFSWASAPLGGRLAFFILAFIALELYMTQTYGHLTKPKEGPDHLLLPASTLEKYVSMMVMTLIVLPVLFVVTYLGLDALLCKIDPGCGKSLYTGAIQFWDFLVNGLYDLNTNLGAVNVPVRYAASDFILLFVSSVAFSFLFYLYAGLLFRRFKILFGILSNWGLGIVFSIFGSAFMPTLAERMMTMDESEGAVFARMMTHGTTGFLAAGCVILAVLCYIRLKKISH